MRKAASRALNAVTLRIILSISLFLITGLAGGGFLYVQTELQNYAIEVSHKKIDAAASNGTIQALEATKLSLANDQNILQKANTLKYSKEFPEFKIVEVVAAYAAKNGLSIDSFDFATADSSTGGPGGAAAPVTAPASTTPTSATTDSKSVSMTVTFAAPIRYMNFLQFLYDVEQILPKMQVKALSLKPGTSSDTILSGPVIIEMYTR